MTLTQPALRNKPNFINCLLFGPSPRACKVVEGRKMFTKLEFHADQGRQHHAAYGGSYRKNGFLALRENSEKSAIGGDFGVLPFLEFPQLASTLRTDSVSS
jgi:hypothetical protein